MIKKQGDIFFAHLDPIQGSEQVGKRPVVIVSGDTMNKNMSLCVVCLCSSKLKYFSTSVVVKKNKTNGLLSDSEIITFQVRTISTKRLGKKIGKIEKDQIREVLYQINNILTF